MPKIGQALVWNNLLNEGGVNPNTFHAGLPVLEGSKYVITKWFRENS
jgi:prolyl 4-hydroxylase